MLISDTDQNLVAATTAAAADADADLAAAAAAAADECFALVLCGSSGKDKRSLVSKLVNEAL